METDCSARTLLLSLIGCLFLSLPGTITAADAPAEVPPELEIVSPGVKLTLIAEHPDVVTPTGIDVDDAGNVWAVVCHTHFRPDNYDGPEHDEIVMLDPSGTRNVFYNRTDATMDLELGSDGWVYLAERDRVLRVRDTDGDGVGDLEENIAVLETEADYPHNGLSGMAWHPDGDLVFALGENFWKQWTLTAPVDGSSVEGTGEGGIFRCRPDGSNMRRIARGFWNPFGICVRSDGAMFAGENDPGARPPCRLLHIVPGGDYGYNRKYGNAPIHPFVCWNGELPGTLPMMHRVGEAPCGIAPLGNGLVVGSWTDHRIDFYPLTAKGASFETKRVTLIRGGHHFRPTCIAKVSPTVFYLTDWVFGSYQLHKRGRVWKLEIDPEAAIWLGDLPLQERTETAKRARQLRSGDATFTERELFGMARSSDPFLASAAIHRLSKRMKNANSFSADLDARDRVTLLLAVKKSRPHHEPLVHQFLDDENEQVVFEALRWIADEELKNFLPDIDQKLEDSTISYQIFEACLAARNAVLGNASAGVVDQAILLKRINDPKAPASTRAFALRLVDPQHKRFAPAIWRNLTQVDDPQLTGELVRTLAACEKPTARDALLSIATNSQFDSEIRADAIAGLAGSSKAIKELMQLAESEDASLREEALRSLRFTKLSGKQKQQLVKVASTHPRCVDLVATIIDPESVKSGRPSPTNTDAWRNRLAQVAAPVDRDAGRRIFHHRTVGTCSKCHRHSGRGGVVGPDLTKLSAGDDHQRLMISLLQPSREVDPQYYARTIMTEDGDVFTGIMLRDGGGGTEVYRDNAGRERKFSTKEITERKELQTSLMPDGLIDLMTDREIRDVLAFLAGDAKATRLAAQHAGAESFDGTWWLDFPDGYGGWLQVIESENEPLTANLLWRVGSPRPMQNVKFEAGKLYLSRSHNKRPLDLVAHREGADIVIKFADPSSKSQPSKSQPSKSQPGESQVTARGRRCPPMPPKPDLSKVKWGPPIKLFNERDLTGWQLQPADANNGWSVRNGELINETPKTDFSGYGSYGNLRSERVFGDCRVDIEFNIGTKRNSGIYVRGLYEAQVVDRDSPMQGISGPGAIFGRIKPLSNAGLPGGQWQKYQITLVDRHITVRLNDQLVIDNQPVLGCTGGALFGDVTRDGPLYLQGDHTSVRYRHIRVSPRIN